MGHGQEQRYFLPKSHVPSPMSEVTYMCGIVGLLLKNPSLRPRLGELMVPMMIGMTERGPDSAGLAVFSEPVERGTFKISLYTGEHAVSWKELLSKLRMSVDGKHEIETSGNHGILTTTATPE